MDVRTLCLGVLCEGSASGYDIKKRLEQTYSHFFQASYGSIYPALNRLTEEGLVSCAEQAQSNRPDKKLYTLTPQGRLALIRALGTPPAPDRVRSEFLATMLFAELLEPGYLDQVLDTYLEEKREELAKIDACVDTVDSPGRRFVMGYGQAVYRAIIEYIEDNRHLAVGQALMSRAQGSDRDEPPESAVPGGAPQGREP